MFIFDIACLVLMIRKVKVKKIGFTLFSFILFNQYLFSQKNKIIQGEETVFLSSDQTLNQIKSKAIDLAKINALEAKFGRLIYQNNQSYVDTENGKTNTNFYSKGNSFVKGKWIKTIEENCNQGYDSDFGQIFVTCKVKGYARELNEVVPEFETYALECADKNCIEENFTTGQDFFLFFKSPSTGYLAVFLTDLNNTYKLLPLPGDRSNLYKVIANKEYFLFSEDLDISFDGYFLYTDKNVELNTVYVVFSKEDFSLPILDEISEFQEIKIPESIEITSFHEWLNNLRISRENVQVKEILISILKN